MKLGVKTTKNGCSIYASENNVLSRDKGFSGRRNSGNTWNEIYSAKERTMYCRRQW
jgi:hypothetical protein